MVPERQVWSLVRQPPREEGRARPLGQPPSFHYTWLRLLRLPRSQPPCPQPRGDWILPGTSCACFFCMLFRQEMGMRWEVEEGGGNVSLSLPSPSFRAGGVGVGSAQSLEVKVKWV